MLYLFGPACLSLDYITNFDMFMETVRTDAAEFRPLGEKVHEYTVREERAVEAEFEIYKVSWWLGLVAAIRVRWHLALFFTLSIANRTLPSSQSTFESSKFRSYHKRLQTFLLFFVEAASFVDDEDTRWEIYTV